MKLGDIKVTTAIIFLIIGAVLYKLGFLFGGFIALGLLSAIAIFYAVKIVAQYIKDNGAPAIGLVALAVITWILVGFKYWGSKSF